MQISSNFDAGNIIVVANNTHGENERRFELEIRKDNLSDFYQWFYFRVSGARGKRCEYRIVNAGEAAYPLGFSDYKVVYSYDRQNWLRHPTTLANGVMTFDFTAEFDTVYFAYFAPYSMERHHDLIATSLKSSLCRHRLLGRSVDGQDIDLLHLSSTHNEENKSAEILTRSSGKAACWITARQHPGETMAQWWMEGFLQAMLDDKNAAAKALLQQCDLFLVPNMNPDGSRRGHLRTNAAGKNLNREWAEPTMESSPEVYLVRQAMNETGVDFFLDVHGDESLPYCFIAGVEGLTDWDEKMQNQLDFYKNRLAEVNSDFQTRVGYPAKPKGQANLTMSTGQTAENHKCLAMTLEMPFKDTTATSEPNQGWSPERSGKLAQSCLTVLNEYLSSEYF